MTPKQKFLATVGGALIPLLPWFFGGGNGALVASIALAACGAAGVGAALARFTDRSVLWSGGRQVLIAAVAAAVTYGIGTAVGTG